MCLSIPAKIDKIEKVTGVCTFGTGRFNASLELLVHVGDYVLIHTGFAIQK